MLLIDGSAGEGGGQILRSSLALSLVTGTPFRIEGIRAGRDKPGLLRQHLTAVEAARRIGGAKVEGAEIGSLHLTFRPRSVTPGDYTFSIGTAGSTVLVLQTVLPALLTAGGPSRLTLEGGTHNPAAPPFEFFERVFVPQINRMGPTVSAVLERPGFHPAGGGRLTVDIQPADRLRGFELLERGELRTRRATAMVAHLPDRIADRELDVVARRLSWKKEWLRVERADSARGPGNILLVEIESERAREIITAFGSRGKTAEAVAERASEDARRYLASGVPVGSHLADQILLPLSLAGGGAYRTLSPSRHLRTNAAVIETFLGIGIRMEPVRRNSWDVVLTRSA